MFYKRILRAAEKTPYTDQQGTDIDYAVDTDDIETSTPDHTTTSDPDITVASHLAVQERAFSEDNVRIQMDNSMDRIHIDNSTDSGLNITAEAEFGAPDPTTSDQLTRRRNSDVTPHSSSNEGTLRAERRADSSSCVVLNLSETNT